MESFAILIPTRNRPKELSILLRSIQKSTRLPKQVVVVASGQNVAHILDELSKSLEIPCLHTEVTGQIAQKRLGVELVSKEVDWCLFLDDDLILKKSAIDLALSAARSYEKKGHHRDRFKSFPFITFVKRFKTQQKIFGAFEALIKPAW